MRRLLDRMAIDLEVVGYEWPPWIAIIAQPKPSGNRPRLLAATRFPIDQDDR